MYSRINGLEKAWLGKCLKVSYSNMQNVRTNGEHIDCPSQVLSS